VYRCIIWFKRHSNINNDQSIKLINEFLSDYEKSRKLTRTVKRWARNSKNTHTYPGSPFLKGSSSPLLHSKDFHYKRSNQVSLRQFNHLQPVRIHCFRSKPFAETYSRTWNYTYSTVYSRMPLTDPLSKLQPVQNPLYKQTYHTR